MKKVFWIPMVLVLALTAYLAFWPVPIQPVAWQAPKSDGLTGAYAENSKLANPATIDLDGGVGPESVTLAPDGKLYMGLLGGNILRFAALGGTPETFVNTGGRPLGLAVDAQGNLIVADAFKGLLSIAPDGKQTMLLRAGADAEISFPNSVTVGTSGKIYITDSSRRFPAAHWGSTNDAAMLEVFEQSASGRVMEYDPRTKHVRVVADSLSLPNGIVLSGDETQLLVSESGRYRIWQIAASADRLDLSKPSESARVLLDNLPAYPDNLSRGLNGRIWLGLAGQRNVLDQMADRPFLRRMILRIPRFMWSMPKPFGHVLAFTEDGTVVADLQDPTGQSPTTTGATETADRLYIHNVDGKRLDWLPRRRFEAGLKP
ncbi:SMP-30/gluconolactonase/LRE family protein [Massilia sp. BSC265]|uniref:SMP-30/gluconolactonase/LRE family protein n=1 Tax=Massilia sp. BSC265 TaxID=1549812 RepID=UPI0004E873D3|nr:SMP-30/gluconolactonase/LRE family protein [Massilia sp. BSC265]KFI07171.1 strictosidine synthase [Massilia sp. BSC265]